MQGLDGQLKMEIPKASHKQIANYEREDYITEKLYGNMFVSCCACGIGVFVDADEVIRYGNKKSIHFTCLEDLT